MAHPLPQIHSLWPPDARVDAAPVAGEAVATVSSVPRGDLHAGDLLEMAQLPGPSVDSMGGHAPKFRHPSAVYRALAAVASHPPEPVSLRGIGSEAGGAFVANRLSPPPPLALGSDAAHLLPAQPAQPAPTQPEEPAPKRRRTHEVQSGGSYAVAAPDTASETSVSEGRAPAAPAMHLPRVRREDFPSKLIRVVGEYMVAFPDHARWERSREGYDVLQIDSKQHFSDTGYLGQITRSRVSNLGNWQTVMRILSNWGLRQHEVEGATEGQSGIVIYCPQEGAFGPMGADFDVLTCRRGHAQQSGAAGESASASGGVAQGQSLPEVDAMRAQLARLETTVGDLVRERDAQNTRVNFLEATVTVSQAMFAGLQRQLGALQDVVTALQRR